MNGYERILRNCLFVMLIFANGLALAVPGRQEVQEMRTLAVLATTNVLLYYNSNGTPMSRRVARHSANTLSG